MRILLVTMCLMVLVGCAGTQADTAIQGDLSALQKFTTADLQAALDDATKANDQAAVNCYTTLLTVVKSQNIQAPHIVGALSAFQAGRDVIGGSGASAVMKQINIGCAALFVDATITMGKIAGMAGVGLPPLPVGLP